MDALSAVHPAQRIVFMKGAQVGAPLAIDTPIPTAAGWATMGSLVVGDTLFDELGVPCRVTGIGLVAYLCRSNYSFRLLCVRKPGGFCLLTLNACGAGYRSR